MEGGRRSIRQREPLSLWADKCCVDLDLKKGPIVDFHVTGWGRAYRRRGVLVGRSIKQVVQRANRPTVGVPHMTL